MRIQNVLLSLATLAAAIGIFIAYGFVAIAVEAVPRANVGSCAAYSGLPSGDHDTAGMTFIQAGAFTMGSERHQPEERFTHVARVDGFWIDRHEVTNARNSSSLSTRPVTSLWQSSVSMRKLIPDCPKSFLLRG